MYDGCVLGGTPLATWSAALGGEEKIQKADYRGWSFT